MCAEGRKLAEQHETEGLRLMVYDRTCRGRAHRPGLSHAWGAGSLLYRGLGRLDAAVGVECWGDALAWLAQHGGERPIAEIQYWGHGKWGAARVGGEVFDIDALAPQHRWGSHLDTIRRRLSAGSQPGLFWFRTCETLGCVPGQTFAQAFAERLDCRIAGHTFIIGHWQSGLHSLRRGETPQWSVHEGLREGDPEDPRRAEWSRAWKANTVSFLHGHVPQGY